MARYEVWYEEIKPTVKNLKDFAAAAARLQKSIQKDADSGNLVGMKKNIEALAAAAESLKESVAALDEQANGFDTKDYFISGDFERELLEACEAKEINVIGERGIYEMFPYKVRITGDEEHDTEVHMDRKKIPSFRPSFVAETIRAGQEKLNKAKFNSQTFMDELAEGYETACLKSGARMGSTQKLEKIYKAMAPTARARKEYDKQAFAFDLSRIYEKGPDAWVTKDGRRYNIGTSREGTKNGYRVLSSTGVEQYIYTLKKVNDTEE